MELVLHREIFLPTRVFGRLMLEGERICYTLEDPTRPVKIPEKTGIPVGRYRMIIDWSPRFKHDLPHILDVPGFVGVRIHPGNTEEDTHGCVLAGEMRTPDRLYNSTGAMARLMARLHDARAKDEGVWLTVQEDPRGPPPT